MVTTAMSADMNIIACSSVLLTSSCVNNIKNKNPNTFVHQRY